MPRAARIPAIDVLKTLAILTVVWIHAFPANVEPQPLIRQLHYFTRFAVPALFFTSGMLAWGGRRPWGDFVRRRLPRLLGPYLIASALAMLYRHAVRGIPVDLADALFAITTGSAFGPYYFVPVLMLGSIALRGLESAPRLLGPVALCFVATNLASNVYPLFLSRFVDEWLFWSLRNPFRWWAYVFAGAWVATRWHRVARWGLWRCVGACATAGVLWSAVAASGLLAPDTVAHVAQWLLNWTIIALILASTATARDWRPVRTVAELSYPIYLYHLFVVSFASTLWFAPGPGRRLGVWAVAVATSAGVGWLGRRLLGDRARVVTG